MRIYVVIQTTGGWGGTEPSITTSRAFMKESDAEAYVAEQTNAKRNQLWMGETELVVSMSAPSNHPLPWTVGAHEIVDANMWPVISAGTDDEDDVVPSTDVMRFIVEAVNAYVTEHPKP